MLRLLSIVDDASTILLSELGKPIGNDKERGKCTYVTKYGLEKSKEILDDITKEAVSIIETFGQKGEFLKELALYIESRNK